MRRIEVQERDEKNRELTGKVNSLQRELSRKDKDIKNLRDRLSNPSQVQDVRRMLEDPLKGLHAEKKKKEWLRLKNKYSLYLHKPIKSDKLVP